MTCFTNGRYSSRKNRLEQTYLELSASKIFRLDLTDFFRKIVFTRTSVGYVDGIPCTMLQSDVRVSI